MGKREEKITEGLLSMFNRANDFSQMYDDPAFRQILGLDEEGQVEYFPEKLKPNQERLVKALLLIRAINLGVSIEVAIAVICGSDIAQAVQTIGEYFRQTHARILNEVNTPEMYVQFIKERPFLVQLWAYCDHRGIQ